MSYIYPAVSPQTPLPSRQQIYDLWDKYGMLDNIRDHSRVVTMVALAITDWLAEAGLALNRPAVKAGAMLHDIAKTPCLNGKCLHHLEGERILLEEGYPELAFMVLNHIVVPEGHPVDETMLVNYADKRVTHDAIVSLDERYDYIVERYGRGEPERLARLAKGRARIHQVERSIFAKIPHKTPADIGRLEAEA